MRTARQALHAELIAAGDTSHGGPDLSRATDPKVKPKAETTR